MSDNQVLNIQAVVDLLDRRAPAVLNEIRDKHHQYQEILRPGKMLGEPEQAEDHLVADLLSSTVGLAKQESELTYQLVSRRMKTSARFRLVSSIVSATSSGGLIAVLLHGRPEQALIAATLAFASSGFLLVAQYVEDYAGGKDSLRTTRDRVVSFMAEAVQIEGELRIMQVRGAFDEAVPLIRKLNTLVASVRQVQLAIR